MSAVSATRQDAVAGGLVRQSPTVVVRDADGHPVVGVLVTFVHASDAAPQFARTGADGETSVGWFANLHSGVDRLTARADGLAGVEFVADVRAGPAAQFVPDVDLDQVGAAGETLSVQPSVRVADQYGNAVLGSNVTFTVAGAAASIIEHATAVTDSYGHASAGAWTLGSATGDYTLTAAAAEIPGNRVVFRARINAPFAVSSVAAGGTSSCAIASNGTYCWGSSVGGYPRVLTPGLVGSGPPLVTLVVGNGHACGLTSSGTAYCWGDNRSGQLGLGTSSETEPRARAVAGGLTFTTLVAGDAFTCGLTTDQRMYCWGDNTLGQLGIDSSTSRSIPMPVATRERIATMAAGYRHACAIATSGTTYCWGANDTGQLGGPAGDICQIHGFTYYDYYPYTINVSCSRTPVPLPNAPGAFTALVASSGTCGLLGSGQSYCWGFSRSTVPTEGRFVSLAAAAQSVCGITTTQSISCWAYADSTAPPSKLTVVPGIADPIGLVSGHTHWCAIGAAAKTAFCWGGNIDGQLGNGTLASTARPLPVAAP